MRDFLRRKYKLLIGIFLIIGIGIIVALKYFPGQNQAAGEQVQVKRGNIRQTLTLSGLVAARERALLQFQTSAQLEWMGVKLGDRVRKYQALARLDVRETQKNLEKELKTYLDTRWDFDQLKDDNKDPLVSDRIKRILQQSQFGLDKAVLGVEIKHLALELSTLTSPINGVVTRIDVPFAGVNITPAGARIEVVNPESYYFELTADQTDVAVLKEGLVTKITLDAFAEEQLGGEIALIGLVPKSGETGTVYPIEVNFRSATSSGQLRIGMTGDAEFVLKEAVAVLVVPTRLISTDKQGEFVLTGDKKEKVYIKTGIDDGEMTEVISGLSEGQVIYD